MKQAILIMFFAAVLYEPSRAQTFDELFRQKKTQRKYLAQQIAALKVYLDYLKEGYRITKKGLAIVGDITGNNFSDHQNYFDGLSLVNEALGGTSIQQTITLYQRSSTQRFKGLLSDQETINALTTPEINYVNAVHRKVEECFRNSASWLVTLASNDDLKMREDERIVELSKVIEDIRAVHVFSTEFVNSTRLLVKQRNKEQGDVQSATQLVDQL